MTVTFSLQRAMVTEHTHAKIEVKSQLAQKLQWKQTTGQTDTTDSSTLPEVGNQTDIYSAPMGERSIVMTVSICVSVCVSVVIISLETHVRSLPIFVHVTYGRGSVLLWRRCDMLCTSSFMDDAILAHKPRQLNVAAQLIEAQPTCSLINGA